MTTRTEIAVPAVEESSIPGYASRWRALIFIAISLLVISIDNTILNVALPSISRNLGASASELQWIIDGYVLVFASLLLTMGSLGDRIGRKRSLQTGLFLFALGSLGCALSITTSMLILARAFTGIGAALIMPATLSIINASFPENERPGAIAIWAAIFGLGIGIGPLAGGLLLKYFGWQSIFFINLPVAAVGLIGGRAYIVESRDEHTPGLDLPGVLLSITGMFALVFGIISTGEFGWTAPRVLVAFGIALVLLTMFMLWESRAPNAMVPLRFFANPSFAFANTNLVLMTFGLFGLVFMLTQYFQSVLDYEPLLAGFVQLPVAIAVMVISLRSAKIVQRLGLKRTVASGSLLAGLAFLYTSFSFGVHTPYYLIFIGQVMYASGVGLMMSPSTNSVMQSVPVRKSGIGSAMNDMTRQLGGALGVAVLGSIVNGAYRNNVVKSLEPFVQLPETARQTILRSIQGAHIVASQLPDPARNLIIDAVKTGFVEGMRQASLVGAVVMFAAAILTFLFLPDRVERTLDSN